MTDTAIREVLDGIRTAWTVGDADAFAALYSSDAVVVLPGGIHHQGREEIRAYMKAGFAGPLKDSRGVDEPEQIRLFPGGTAALVVSRAGILLAGETELPPSRQRRAVWVLSKQDDRWVIESYTNTPLAA